MEDRVLRMLVGVFELRNRRDVASRFVNSMSPRFCAMESRISVGSDLGSFH
jgi:hypothetical protein